MNAIIWKSIIIDGIKPYYEINTNGCIRNKYTNKILKQTFDKERYLRVNLASTKKKSKRFLVHRLVALTFIPNPNNLATVNHINYDKANNSIENLEWMSAIDNIKDAKKHGRFLHRKGEDAPNSKYKSKQIKMVCEYLQNGLSNKEISELTGIQKNIIVFIKNGSIWTHISKNYNIPKPKDKMKFKKWYKIFDHFIMDNYDWKYVKELYHISGKDTKSLRQLYHRREAKILQSSTTIQMRP